MAGIAGLKFTVLDIKKLYAYAMENRIEPKTIETKVQADMFNKREKLTARILGLHATHEWKVGDRFYELPIKAKDEDSLSQAALGMGLEGPEEVEEDVKDGKPVRKKSKNVPKMDGKLRHKKASEIKW